MNGFNGEILVEDVDAESDELESEEDEAESEPTEFWPGFPLPPLPPIPGLGGRSRRSPGRQSYFTPPPTSAFVTQAQLNRALGKVRTDVRNVGTRLSRAEATTSRLARDAATQAKVNVRQSKDIAATRVELKKAREMGLMLTLLTRPKTLLATTTPDSIGGADVPVGTKVNVTGGNDISPLLLVALMSSQDGGGGFSGMDPLMMVFLLRGL